MLYAWKPNFLLSFYKSKKTIPRSLLTEIPPCLIGQEFAYINKCRKNGISKIDLDESGLFSGAHGGGMDSETNLGNRE